MARERTWHVDEATAEPLGYFGRGPQFQRLEPSGFLGAAQCGGSRFTRSLKSQVETARATP